MMKAPRRTNKFLNLILFGAIVLLALPAVSFAQGRGRGRGANLDKKCAKFVNCHDARDGRWDGRGPNRTSNGNRDDIFSDRDIIYPNGRNRRVDRDGDGDFDRDDVILGRNRRVDRDGDGDFDRDDVIVGRNRRVDRDGDGDFDRNDVRVGRNRRVDRDGDGDFDRNDVILGRRQDRQRWERRDGRYGRLN
jgi:hypothetical protein